MNQQLKDDLQDYFEPLGIVAWSGCCRWSCTGSYGGDGQPESEFKVRQAPGIYYIRFSLDGMNYNPDTRSCSVSYDQHEWLMENWESEEGLLKTFCSIIGLQEDEYQIIKPTDQSKCVMIEFKKELNLTTIFG